MIIGNGINAKYNIMSAADGQVCHLELASSKSVDVTIHTWAPDKKTVQLSAMSKEEMKSAIVIIDVVATIGYSSEWPDVKIISRGRITSCKVKITSIPEKFNGNRPVSIVFLDGNIARLIEITGYFNRKAKFNFRVTKYNRQCKPSAKEDLQWVKKI